MMSSHAQDFVLKTTLIDCGSIMQRTGHVGQDKVFLEEFIKSARALTQDRCRVMDHFRRTRNGEKFELEQVLHQKD